LAAIGDLTPGRLASITEFRDHLLGIGLAYSEVLASEPRLMRLIVVQAAGVDQQMTEEFQRVFDDGARVLRAMLRDGIDQGYIRADVDVQATAQTVCAIPFGIALRYGQKPSREELIAQTLASNEMVCRGIATEWPAPNPEGEAS
ncbi:MAG: TetR/AcrR family transcriptional regulator C-terminal ligand-binding domain-containing protein, partial [Mycobacterium sp.]|nr:TetR/AcrR family transcriptional regulator C-terminal ligand-binding domain-containing protein [Mycobacterium sp.]